MHRICTLTVPTWDPGLMRRALTVSLVCEPSLMVQPRRIRMFNSAGREGQSRNHAARDAHRHDDPKALNPLMLGQNQAAKSGDGGQP